MDEKASSWIDVGREKVVRFSIMTRMLFARVGLTLAVLGFVLWRYEAFWEDTKPLGFSLWGCGMQANSGKLSTSQRWSEVSERP